MHPALDFIATEMARYREQDAEFAAYLAAVHEANERALAQMRADVERWAAEAKARADRIVAESRATLPVWEGEP